MSVTIGSIGVIALVLLLILRIPVAMALIGVSFGGIAAMVGFSPAIGILANTPYSIAASWTLSAVPMFVLMGFVAFNGGLTAGLFDAAKLLLGRLPGGLAISSIFASTGFAAVCGSSLACAAAMGRIAIPQMIAAGYRAPIAAGCIAAGGTLGALIPPSLLLILFGIFTETSITQLFIGGIGVGLATALSYCIVVLAICWLRPDWIPSRTDVKVEGNIRASLISLVPVVALAALIFGGMFTGLFSATEAGAAGALGTIVITACTGKLSWSVLWNSILETVGTSGAFFIVGIGAAMFTRFLGLSGMSAFIESWVAGSGLSFVGLMFVIVVIYLIIGTFMEPLGAMMVTIPVFAPLVSAQGGSLVWFGVLVVKLLEIGMITPPVGMNVFVIKNVAGKYVTLMQIFAGVIPFLIADLVVVTLVIVFPALVLFLPQFIG
jgi:tripartite ATP-independent transporter DctM subunit